MANIWGNKNLRYYLLVWEQTLENYIEMSHIEGREDGSRDKLVDGLRMRTFTIQLCMLESFFFFCCGKCIANSKEHITKIEVLS